MSRIRMRLLHVTEPLVAAVFLCVWLLTSAGKIVTYVPSRDSSAETGTYTILITVGFAIAIAICRFRPLWSVVLVGGLLLLQLLFWPTRFNQTNWPAYLGLAIVAVGVTIFWTHGRRPAVVIGSSLYSTSIAALLTIPALSYSGAYGTLTGKPSGSIEVVQSFLAWAIVGALVAVVSLRIGSAVNSRPQSSDGRNTDSHAEESPRLEGLRDPVGSTLDGNVSTLSPREREIFDLVSQGLSNSEIARAASISESTVKTHLSSILAKLGLSSRSQIVVFAYESGLRDRGSVV